MIGDSNLGQVAELQFRVVFAPEIGDCEFEVVDILQHPEQARQYQVLATPLLLRVDPQPSIRIVGNLINAAEVRLALQLPGDDGPEDGRDEETQLDYLAIEVADTNPAMRPRTLREQGDDCRDPGRGDPESPR